MTLCYRLALVVLILISVEFASSLSPKCGLTLLKTASARSYSQTARSYKPSKKSAQQRKRTETKKKKVSVKPEKILARNKIAKPGKRIAQKVQNKEVRSNTHVAASAQNKRRRSYTNFLSDNKRTDRRAYANFLAEGKRNKGRNYSDLMANNKRKKGRSYSNLLAGKDRNKERRRYLPKMASGGFHPNTSLARKIASNAESTARCMTSQGLCYRGVKRAVAPLGIELHGNAAYRAKSQLMKDKRFRVVANRVKPAALKRGDILVHNKSAGKPYGHIAVYLGNGKEASDHIQKLVHGIGYGGTTVFRPVRQSNERGKDS